MSSFGHVIEVRNGETWRGAGRELRPPREQGSNEITRSVERPGWCTVRQLADGIGNPAPHGLAFVVVLRGEFVRARGAFLGGLVAIPLEHEVGGAPDVDLGYHGEQVARFRSPIV